MGQVVEGITIARALLSLALQQAVQRAGQAQQLARVLLAEALASARFDFIQFLTQTSQGA